MFDLVYNVDFEVTAFFFTILLYFEIILCYPKNSRKNRIFRMMTVMVIITQAFDLASAYTNTCAASLPTVINLFINAGYFMSGLFLCFVLYYYVENAFLPENRKAFLTRTNKILLTLMEAAVALNGFTGWFFYFTPEGVYTHGPLYLGLHLVSIWFVLCGSTVLFINRRLLKAPQIITGVLFILLYVTSVIFQTFFIPDILVIMPAATAMLVITNFTLETPDYVQLQAALKELTDMKQELEEANEKYYNLAYLDIMTGLRNRTAYNLDLELLQESEGSVIFLMADVNNLKYLNDFFGHSTGDEAIIRAAGLLARNFRENCRCYRIGGDEFAVIGQNVGSAVFAKSYRDFLEEVQAEAGQCEYPFSVASAYQEAENMSLSEAMRRADEKMYQNKNEMKRNFEVLKGNNSHGKERHL